MAAAWAQANPAAQAKLERAQRSYNEASRGMGFAARAKALQAGNEFGSEQSERIVSEANDNKFAEPFLGLAPYIGIPFL